MVQSVLGSLILGYRPLWNRARKLAAIQLYVHSEASALVDTAHLLRTLQELWSASSPPILLSPQSHQLLSNMLEHAPRGAPWIEVRGNWLSDSTIYALVKAAHQRGLKLVWRGELGRLPEPDIAQGFDNSLLSLRHQPQQPSHAVIFKLMKAIDAEQSLETFEDIMGQDPILAYRFMVYTNSAALGLRTGIDSLRRGLVMMGYGSIKRWLSDQLPHASTDPNMQPVREAMVMRAQLTAQLLDAGVENDLRREIYLCGLLSQIDDLLGEPLGTILRRLPLSDRIYDATVLRTGPYTGGLQMACALETDDASAIRNLCETFELDLEEVNRALLRVLADLEVERR